MLEATEWIMLCIKDGGHKYQRVSGLLDYTTEFFKRHEIRRFLIEHNGWVSCSESWIVIVWIQKAVTNILELSFWLPPILVGAERAVQGRWKRSCRYVVHTVQTIYGFHIWRLWVVSCEKPARLTLLCMSLGVVRFITTYNKTIHFCI